MKWVDFGQEAHGFIAVGQKAHGVIAIGQLASGVIAIGQLARGVFVLGQLACGVVAFGQVTVGALWAGGMLSAAPFRGPGLLSIGYFGRLRLRSRERDLLGFEVGARRSTTGTTVAVIASVLTLALVIFVALRPVWRDVADVFDKPRELR